MKWFKDVFSMSVKYIIHFYINLLNIVVTRNNNLYGYLFVVDPRQSKSSYCVR